jgi:translocon-associated protein subunit gamma
MIDLYSSIISFIGVTCVSTYLVALAYKNTKFVLKHKVRYDLNFQSNERHIMCHIADASAILLLR